ncbi:hypothetical protein [Luteimonas sp. RC10]|uniref:hypothetical protein n=1 Tax=Luteimonas sp. RC10 TaxID=2587035 RepID=UPI00161BFCA6|nr:hypothetical protein [Luteimonas sp. RC10]MBB3342382.1 hypothetical protein [Luteimonas sp. RC10]
MRSMPFPHTRPGLRHAATALLLAGLLSAGCAKIDTPPALVKPLHIDLSAPVAEQVDLAWPQRDGALASEHTIAQARQVTLRLPDGRQLTVPAERVAFRQQDGMLASVNIEPSGAGGEHTAALNQVRGLLEDNRLLDPTLAHELDGWAVAGGAPQTARVVIRDVDVQVGLRPDRRIGWQSTLDFSPRPCQMPAGLDGDPDACLHAPPTTDGALAEVQG